MRFQLVGVGGVWTEVAQDRVELPSDEGHLLDFSVVVVDTSTTELSPLVEVEVLVEVEHLVATNRQLHKRDFFITFLVLGLHYSCVEQSVSVVVVHQLRSKFSFHLFRVEDIYFEDLISDVVGVEFTMWYQDTPLDLSIFAFLDDDGVRWEQEVRRRILIFRERPSKDAEFLQKYLSECWNLLLEPHHFSNFFVI